MVSMLPSSYHSGLTGTETTKLTLGNGLPVYTSHNVPRLLSSSGSLWQTDSWLLKYRSLMLAGPTFQLKACSHLNPATFLLKKTGEPEHDGKQVVV